VTTQTVQLAGAAALPRVNLLPPEIAEAARFRRVQLAMGGAVLVAVVAVAGLHMHAKSGVSSAQQSLTAAQASNTVLQSKLNGLAHVSATYAAVQNQRTMLQSAMGTEVNWSSMLADLSLRMPSNVWLTAIQATETSAPGSQTPTTVPGTIGTVLFSGVGYQHSDVAAWLIALAKERGYTQPTFTGSTETSIGSRHVVDFGSTALLTPAAQTNRYVMKAGS
jgi:Tfp pilus assembly protein PilN